MVNREESEKRERTELAPYACFSDTAERVKGISSHNYRTEFQRDRDRIIHSKAFRRLEYKTQVYLSMQSDHMRTRLTHSLEVSQLSRTIAGQLKLNTDLVEAISLGHDVGHTPFGHAAEKRLNEILEEYSLYFKHNMQSVRVFELLEKKYSSYSGINLTIPVLEGILKHTKFYIKQEKYLEKLNLDNECSFTLEGQVVAISDEIAQITHDTDDFLRANVLQLERIISHKIFSEVKDFIKDKYSHDLILDGSQPKEEIIRCLVDYLVSKLCYETEKVLHDDLRAYSITKNFLTFGTSDKIIKEYHDFLDDLCFEDYGVKEMDRRGKQIITTLFEFYMKFPERLPSSTKEKFDSDGYIVLADFISGMTDKFAIKCYDSIIDI